MKSGQYWSSAAQVGKNRERWISVSNAPAVETEENGRVMWRFPMPPDVRGQRRQDLHPGPVHAGRGGRQNHGDIADTDRRLSSLTQQPFLNLTGPTPTKIALEPRATCSPRAPGVTCAEYCCRASSDGDGCRSTAWPTSTATSGRYSTGRSSAPAAARARWCCSCSRAAPTGQPRHPNASRRLGPRPRSVGGTVGGAADSMPKSAILLAGLEGFAGPILRHTSLKLLYFSFLFENDPGAIPRAASALRQHARACAGPSALNKSLPVAIHRRLTAGAAPLRCSKRQAPPKLIR
jgi:hypothetical protein